MAANEPPPILRSALLAEVPGLVHGFSTRSSGDMAAGAGGQEATLRRFAAEVGGRSGEWRWMSVRQVHSSLIWRDPAPGTAGDGMMTEARGVLLGIRVADCVPILLADVRRGVIAAVHAGWRGTVARIVEKAVGELRAQFGCDPADLRAALGPSIRRCCYQVGAEVVEAFAARFEYAEALCTPAPADPVRERYPMLFMTGAPPGHPRDPRWNYNPSVCLDLAEANRRQLRAAGLSEGAIDVLPYCTSCSPDWFYSYRRDGAQAGRMIAAIGRRLPG